MAIQIWLPLNGNTLCNGLKEVVFYPNAYESIKYGQGKVTSKCFIGEETETDEATRYTFSKVKFEYTNPLTIAAWIKTPSSDSSRLSYVFSNGGISLSGTSTSLTFHYGSVDNTISELNPDTWYHYLVTVENKIGTVYLNGELNNTFEYSFVPSYDEDYTGFCVGCLYENGIGKYEWTGSINDLRVYDNVLSIKEIHDISLGLCARYKFSRGNENIVKGTYLRKTVTGNGDYLTESDLYEINKSVYPDTTYTISFNYSSTEDTTGIFTFTNSENNVDSEMNISEDLVEHVSESGPRIDLSKYHSGVYFGTGKLKATYLKNLRFSAKNLKGSVTISNLKLEVSDVRTPWAPHPKDEFFDYSKNEPDHSGFNRRALPTSNDIPVGVSDTPCYTGSYRFNGSNGIFADLRMSCNLLTIMFWAKVISNDQIIFGNNTLDTSNNEWSWNVNNRLTTPIGVVDYTSTAITNTWAHYAMVYDGSMISVYENGIVVGTTNATGNLDFDVLSFGQGSTNDKWNTCYMSDVRIYTTALSEQDIMSFYKSRFCIDSKHQLYCKEISNDGNGLIGFTKAGVISFTDGVDNIYVNTSSEFTSNDNIETYDFSSSTQVSSDKVSVNSHTLSAIELIEY